ncbi:MULTISPECIES: hypothetical protein [unclassified Rhizobium]|uniref:hypothetical protein n=1 Tax=unclassified Rhizobium TaxID=2613769 RepID=UPI001A97EE0E|nr:MULTISPECIES: hypothetical protein [unclassified Rhizobium]MBX5174458.1 hypothetical protein [Rhizobium sp. NZLR1b]MBX5193648.1 hypothetical protein [Rhizobium sp. NZLR3b]MBX5204185.1 hypothetical protein [Rhizobium sp. NZLR1]MBX5212297.1 hypothetical protein [Rhizobium sp. NZLR11]QSZ25246.1 hypothetical protein J3O30_32150 [Rhizobium sp. NZLR1]
MTEFLCTEELPGIVPPDWIVTSFGWKKRTTVLPFIPRRSVGRSAQSAWRNF